MVKLKDVANLANVSTATVSRVLTGRDKVSEYTKEKVLAAINELNYQPNYLGRQLRELQTSNILVVLPDLSNPFFYDVLQGIELKAMEYGYELLLKDMKNKEKKDLDYFNYLNQKQVAGIILLAVGEQRKIDDLSNGRLVLACAYLEKSEIPNVSINNTESAYKMTKHLISLGHEKIAFIAGGMKTISSGDRLKGYNQALLEAEIEINELYVKDGDYSFQSGINATEKLLELDIPPTAIFAASDQMAAGAIKYIKSKGLSVPEDIAVTGFDNIELASIIDPELTTISQPSLEIGQVAMKMMHKLISGEEILTSKVILEAKLVIRESCGEVLKRDLNRE